MASAGDVGFGRAPWLARLEAMAAAGDCGAQELVDAYAEAAVDALCFATEVADSATEAWEVAHDDPTVSDEKFAALEGGLEVAMVREVAAFDAWHAVARYLAGRGIRLAPVVSSRRRGRRAVRARRARAPTRRGDDPEPVRRAA